MLPASFLTGLMLCSSLIVAIGAQNAFVLRQGLRREHVGAIVLFCASCDLLFISAGVAGMAQFLHSAPTLTRLLTGAGAGFLAGYGVYALRRAVRPQALSAVHEGLATSLPSAMMQVAGFTFLNPHVYLDTLLLMGSVGAQQPEGQRLWFVGGAGLASCVWFGALGFGARALTPLFARARAWQILDSTIALIMFVLAFRLMQQSLQG
jgi:L-lysine exporter family protein LysE/ArgO